jgi:flagellar assembly factor FliW
VEKEIRRGNLQRTDSVLGRLTYEEQEEITILGGILGFEEHERYLLMAAEGQEPFCWLQSLDDPHLAFVAVNPVLAKRDYQPEIPPEELARLEITDLQDEVMWLVIVTLKEKWEESTVNLMAPVVINVKSRQGRQIVLEKGDLSLRYPFLKSAP